MQAPPEQGGSVMHEDRDRKIRQFVESLQATQSDVEPFLALHTPDTIIVNFGGRRVLGSGDLRRAMEAALASPLAEVTTTADRKSTRLNSSHSQISYAVFCLKKK